MGQLTKTGCLGIIVETVAGRKAVSDNRKTLLAVDGATSRWRRIFGDPYGLSRGAGQRWVSEYPFPAAFSFPPETKNQKLEVVKMNRKKELIQEAKSILDKAEAEGRNLTPAEERKYRELLDEIEQLNAYERQGFDPRTALVPGSNETAGGYASPEIRAALVTAATPDYRAAFWRVVRNWRYPDQQDLRQLTKPELRALTIGTDAAGGFLCPESFERRIVQKLEETNVMRGLATVLPLSSDHKIPVEAATGEAAWIAENGTYPESDPSFGQKLLTAHKLGQITKVSEELLADSAIDLEAYLANVFGRNLGRAEEAAFVAGDGVGKPRGVLLDAPIGVTAASATAIAADELVDLFHSLPRPYRDRATWLMNDSTVLTVRKLKDSDGQYIWQPGLQAGQPDRLLGRPVVISSAMPTIGANNKSVLFGALSYYWIADRVGRVFQVLREKYADAGAVGFRLYQRVDGILVLDDAVRVLVHPAA
ncbi:MAG: phage major capsid protein [Bacillota bacterium]